MPAMVKDCARAPASVSTGKKIRPLFADGEGVRVCVNVRFDRSFPRSSVGTQPRTLRRPVEVKRMKMITLQPRLSEALSRGRCAATVRTDLDR